MLMKDIPRFEEKYAITEDGQVWSYKHKKFLKPKLVNGYYLVDIFDKNIKRHSIPIHRLVAMTYIPNPNNYPVVNHKDETRTNNHVSNLEWCTYKYNSNYGTIIDRTNKTKEKENSMKNCWAASVRSRSKPVRCIELNQVFKSASEASRILGINHTHISSCCLGCRNTCGGYHWEFAEVDNGVENDLNVLCGIYKIVNESNSLIYIGQSTNIYRRIAIHKNLLRKNSHSNKELQSSYNLYKDSFSFEIIELCELEELDDKERYWIQYYHSDNENFGFNKNSGGRRKET